MQTALEKIIERLSLYLKIDLKYILAGGGWLFGAQVFSTLCSFGLVWILTNYVSKEVYGEYKYLITLFGIVSVLSLSGYGPSVASSVARGRDGLYKKAVKNIFWSSFPASIISILVAFYYLYNGNLTLFIGLIVIGLVNPSTNAYQIYSSYLSGKKDFKSITFLGAIPDILTLIFTTLTILFSKNAAIIAAVFLFTNLFATALAYYFTNKKYSQNDLPDDKAGEYHGKHNSIISIFSNVIQNLDKVFIFQFLGAAELAIYSLTTQIPDQMKGIFKVVPDLIMAKYSTKENLQKDNVWRKTFYLATIVFVLILLYCLLAPYFFKFLFPEYYNYTYLSQLYALSLIAVVSYYPLSIIQAKLKTKELYWITASTSLVQLVSVIFGVYYFSLIGVVIARIVTRIFTLLAYLLALRQIIK